MADANLDVKNASRDTKGLLARVNGDASLTLYHLEDTAQRAALIAALSAIDGRVDGAEALLTSLLAKVIAAPATEAKQDAVLAALQGATPAGENHLGEVGGNTAVATATFNRPANTTPYSAGDLVANSATAGSVTPLSLAAARKNAGTGRVLRARLSKSGASTTNASFRVHLFKTSPSTTAGDNVAFSAAVNGVAAVYLGSIDVTMDRVFSDGAKGMGALDLGPCISFQAATGATAIFGLIEALAAYTPASAETFTLELEVDRD